MDGTRISRIARGFALALALLSLTADQSRAADDPNAYTSEQMYISSSDGTRLHAVLFRPLIPPEHTPVILEVTPYLNSGGNMIGTGTPNPLGDTSYGPGSLGARGRIFEKGYALLIVALRGHGSSGGCYDLGGPGEQADVVSAVRWAASQPWSSGKVGMWGGSYSAWTQLMALAAANEGRLPELAAIIPKAAPTGYDNYYVNGVRTTGIGHANAAYYYTSDLVPPSLYDTPEHHMTALTGTATNPTCMPNATVGSYSDDVQSPYWQARDLVERTSGATVPALWVHGFDDYNVRPASALAIYGNMRGPRRAILGPWDHGIGEAGGACFACDAVIWYDRWLKADESVDTGPAVVVQNPDGSWRAENAWPPAGVVQSALPIIDGTYVDAAGNASETGLPAAFGAQLPIPLPAGRGEWTFTQPLEEAVRIAGIPVMTATVDALVPGVHMIVLLYDVDPAGGASFVQRGALRVTSRGPVRFELAPIDRAIPAGHRLGVLVTGADDIWFEPGASGTPVGFRTATLFVPVQPVPPPATASGPFRPRTPHPSFKVEVSADRTVDWEP